MARCFRSRSRHHPEIDFNLIIIYIYPIFIQSCVAQAAAAAGFRHAMRYLCCVRQSAHSIVERTEAKLYAKMEIIMNNWGRKFSAVPIVRHTTYSSACISRRTNVCSCWAYRSALCLCALCCRDIVILNCGAEKSACVARFVA